MLNELVAYSDLLDALSRHFGCEPNNEAIIRAAKAADRKVRNA